MVMHQLDARTGKMLEELDALRFRRSSPVSGIQTAVPGKEYCDFLSGDRWGKEEWQDFRFAMEVPVPEAGGQFFLYAATGREGLWDAINPQFLVRMNGRIVQAFDVNHLRMPLPDGQRIEVELQGYCQQPEDGLSYPYLSLTIREVDLALEQLIWDIRTPYEACLILNKGDRERESTLEILSRALDMLDLRQPHSPAFDESVKAARRYLKENYYDLRAKLPPIAMAQCVGHTHIDVAWLWDLHQTRHKAVRSFSTVLSLMDRYPEYKFMSSQPALYDFVKQDAPEVYARIRERIREGRWEVEGGMWVEADCNLSGGEALARQFLMGQRFFESEFGRRCRVLWLPDVFGYSAALPQLMKLSGIDYFMTTKLSWSEYNLTPYDTFMWKGIDGTRVLTHFSPSREYFEEGHEGLEHFTTYNAMLQPSQVAGGWKRFQQKGLDDHFLVIYGYGDGGGGPTDWMLEKGRRMNVPLPGTPAVEMCHSRPFFEQLETRVAGDRRLPEWTGELYLEYHRGTYTAQGHNKRNNRKAELALRSVELRGVQALGQGYAYPAESLNAVWKDVLTLQFHDILPGSSIRKVYEDSDRMYAACFKELDILRDQAEAALQTPRKDSLCIYNDLDYVRDDLICFPAKEDVTALIGPDGARYPVQRVEDRCVAHVCNLTPLGATNFNLERGKREAPEALRVTTHDFETPFYVGKFDAAMRIVSLYDKRAGRELCRAGQALNRIVCYENRPHNHDAWDINIYYDRRHWEVDNLISAEVISEGPVCAVVRVKYAYVHSAIEQDIWFYRDNPRIDFKTRVDWREQRYLLKAHFPVDIFHSEATFDIQYGNVRRATHKNTSWDVARFEVCAHKWADVSEPDYGVALLNDCKYGYSVDDEDLALTLLKSSTYPDPLADQGTHAFTYALLPHLGDWRKGDVVHQGYALNCPAEAVPDMAVKQAESLLALTGEGVIIEAVKQAESGRGIVVRLYECFGRRAKVQLKPGFDFENVSFCNILEESGESAPCEEGIVGFELKPYQIVSLLFT